MDGPLISFYKEAKRSILKLSYKLFPLMLWVVFYSLSLYVRKWRAFSLGSSGRKAMGGKEFIVLNGKSYVFLRRMRVWGLKILQNLIYP